ncbi:RNA ligase-domain-containing protein [Gaertneriomyces semiglobifer]|nr:RNA ligase-domain-containing protein [Gaertneriomyces semiglobifer]
MAKGKKKQHQHAPIALPRSDIGVVAQQQEDEIVSSLSNVSLASPTPTPGSMTVNEMVEAYNDLCVPPPGKGKRRALVKRQEYSFQAPGSVERTVYSYNCMESMFRKRSELPTLARGLFVIEKNESWKIAARGYDKFFNINELPTTKWDTIEENTTGPYELTLKENGCIIFVAAVDGDLLVTSKHALGPAKADNRTADGSFKPSHAEKGNEWVNRHLESKGKTRKELADFLARENLTAVFELADDDFEEHILEYPPDRRGLYMHGLNENVPAFRTRSSQEVAEVARVYGFKCVETIVFQTLSEVRTFTDSCRETGSYQGRAIEGFVIRCRQKASRDLAFFFKVKYDEPYLMFREWREVTNRVRSGKDSTFKPRFQLTKQYIAWVKTKLRTRPELFRDYGNQKGIIAVRNLFLQEAHIDGIGEHIVREARKTTEDTPRQAGAFGKEKVLIIPIAIIGAGKTLLARILTFLYPAKFGHIQNDNINGKRPAPRFAQEIISQFDSKDFVIADKNNHYFQHRQDIIEAFRSSYPGGLVIALDWGIEKMVKDLGLEQLVNICAQRVLQRGENHQSLTPSRAKDFKQIIRSFAMKRDALDLRGPADKGIDEVIALSLTDSPEQHLKKILPTLGLALPTAEGFQKALDEALTVTETVRKEVKDMSAQKKTRYYGISIDKTFDIAKFVDEVFSKHPEADRTFWDELQNARLPEQKAKGWHITLCMKGKGGPTAEELCATYEAQIKRYITDNSGSIQQDPGGRTTAGPSVSVDVEELVWDDRIICLSVSLPDGVRCMNPVPHITVCTQDGVQPVTSNEVLGWVKEGTADGKVRGRIKLPAAVTVTGRICGFYF